MTDKTMKLYQNAGSPNSRRVRIFLAEKGLSIPLIPIDFSKGEQHSDAYRAINSRRVVPTLVLEDGTAIGEVPAILRYLEEIIRCSHGGHSQCGAGSQKPRDRRPP